MLEARGKSRSPTHSFPKPPAMRSSPWFGVGVGIPGVSCWETMEKLSL